jgi:DNA-binding transcriptional regulator YiaG
MAKAEDRFWALVQRRSPDECWLWTGAQRKGYGSFKLSAGDLDTEKRRDVYAHRVAFYLTHGRWPEPQGLHGCDNPLCCNAENPAHVHEGTPKINMQEKYERGRAVHPPGEQSARAVLTNEQAAEIRNRKGVPQRQLAHEYGVSQITVSRIQRGLRYR